MPIIIKKYEFYIKKTNFIGFVIVEITRDTYSNRPES